MESIVAPLGSGVQTVTREFKLLLERESIEQQFSSTQMPKKRFSSTMETTVCTLSTERFKMSKTWNHDFG